MIRTVPASQSGAYFIMQCLKQLLYLPTLLCDHAQ